MLNQFFHPSSAATSQLLTDLARHLAALHHPLAVICGRSDYAAANSGDLPGITVHRTPNLPFGRTRFGRSLSYISYSIGAATLGLTTRRPAVVVTLTTPPLLSLIGTLVKKVRRARHICWEMDVYPDIAVELGVLSPRGPFTRIVGALADWSRRNADAIIALGDDMKDLLIARGIPASRIFVADNWADSAEITPGPFPTGPLQLLYSGNLGLAHDIDTLQHAVLACANSNPARTFQFSFAGSGPRRLPLDSFAQAHQLSNISFRPYCSRSDLGHSLSQCHIGLVTQHHRVAGSVVPSKLYGILAAGRPVIYIGSRDTTPARILRRFNCGWQINPGDSDSLVRLLDTLDKNRSEIERTGARARDAFLENYDRPLGVARVAAIITDTWPPTPETCHPAPDTWHLAPETSPPPDTRHLAPETYLTPDTWHLTP